MRMKDICRVGYLTDIEGNFDFFQRAVEISSVLKFKNRALEFQKETDAFVFGGDSVDNGPGDIRLTRTLVEFKRKYPDRVFLLAGNRDINKMRIGYELDGTVSKLKYILSQTMGAGNAFEHRRKEIKTELATSVISDSMVLDSFSQGLKKGGYMRDYLENAQLMVRIHDSLFVHGALPMSGLGYVPNRIVGNEGTYVLNGLKSWIKELNTFYHEELKTWALRCEKVHSDSSDVILATGGDALIDYGRPGGANGRGIVYNDWLRKGDDTLPENISEKVNSFLHDAGIKRVLSGHRPHGDTPTVIKSEDMYVITSDTAYSDKASPDSRGLAVADVTIDFHLDNQTSSAHIRGIRSDGTDYSFIVENEPLVGKPWVSPYGRQGWIKAVLPGERLLVCFSRGKGSFSSELDYLVINKEDLFNEKKLSVL